MSVPERRPIMSAWRATKRHYRMVHCRPGPASSRGAAPASKTLRYAPLEDPPAMHAVALAPQALETRAAVGVTDRAGKRIGGIRGGCAGERKQPPHHFLHLLLGGLAVTHDRLLDLQRRVLGDGQVGEHGGGDCCAPSLAEQQRRLRVYVDEHFLDRDLGWAVLDDHTADIAQNNLQPLGQVAVSIAYAATGNVMQPPA